MWINYIAPITIILPVVFIMGRPFLRPRILHYLTPVLCGINFFLIISIYPHLFQGNIPDLEIVTGLDINLRFTVDILNYCLGVVSAFIWTLSSIYSIEYQKEDTAINRYNFFSLLSLSGMLGLIFSGNLFTLYIFFEVLTMASAVLVFHQQTAVSLKSGLLYTFTCIIGGLILLIAIIATYNFTGTGDLNLIGVGLKNHPVFAYVFLGYIIGFGVKAGLFPVHIALPSAYSVSPTPASALLAGVMKKAGVYGIIKIVYNIAGKDLLVDSHIFLMSCILVLAMITVFFGSAVAITQLDIKRLLAYSSIAQVGCIIMGVILFSPNSLTGGILHIFNHAIIKASLFLCAGFLIRKRGLRRIYDMQGIGKEMPITTFCFTIAALSLVGVPPLNGFVSKWYLALGALEVEKMGIYHSGTGIICFVLLLLSSFLNLAYYSPIIIGGWFGGERAREEINWNKIIREEIRGPNLWMIIPILIMTFFIIFWGVFSKIPLEIVGKIVKEYFK